MLNVELLNDKKGIIFIDIDETIFKTFAKIHVLKNGEIIKKLSNQEFNSYKLKQGESFDFREFRDGKLFKETSIPIPQTINQLKNMILKIKESGENSRIIFLTAREDFYDKHNFLEKFREQGLEIDNKNLMYIERAGNIKGESVSEKKKKCILKYLERDDYNLVQIIDDDKKNILILKKIAEELHQEFIQKLIKIHNTKKGEPIIIFQGFLVNTDGNLESVFEKTILSK